KGYKFNKAKIFDGYIDKLYKIKQKAEKGSVDYMLSKLLMNSLYGKFGQRREKRKIVVNPDNIMGKEVVNFEMGIYSEEVQSEATHILPAIAAMVTCYARLELYECFEKVQKKKGKIYYCDTDSLITNVSMKTGSKLGELSDELNGEIIKEGYFLLPKSYAYKLHNDKEDIRSKGFPRGTFNFEMIKKAVVTGDLGELKYKKRKFATPFESMRREKSWTSMIEKIRTVRNRYDKRTASMGYDTVPIILHENREVAVTLKCDT
ncbi:hypothetical protein KAH94_06735, partial [bacterium]|nr:hypothetical protein [bacterium]